MVPQIRISDKTWARLQKHAEPFVHTPEDVINLGLDALEGFERTDRNAPTKVEPVTAPSNGRKPAEKLPQKEFRAPLLVTLLELSGRAHTPDIRAKILLKVAHRLSSADHENVSSGDPRWWNATCWERNDLVNEGLLRNDSPRGVWELTEKGAQAARLAQGGV